MIAGLSTEPLQALGNHSVKHRWILQDGGPALQISDEASAKQQISGLETEEGGVRERMGTSGVAWKALIVYRQGCVGSLNVPQNIPVLYISSPCNWSFSRHAVSEGLFLVRFWLKTETCSWLSKTQNLLSNLAYASNKYLCLVYCVVVFCRASGERILN